MAAARLIQPVVHQCLVALEPGVGMTLHVRRLVLPLFIRPFCTLMSFSGSLTMEKALAAAGLASANRLLATMCMVFTAKP